MTTPLRSESTDSPSARSRLVTPAQAWYAVAILTIANVSGFVDRQILNLLVRPIKRDLHVTDTEVSLLMGLSFVVFYSLLGLPIGRWIDRGHRPRIVALGAAVWSIMTMLTGTARSYAHLFIARIGVGAGEATLGPAAVSIIAEQFPRKTLGVAMSTYMMGTFLGSGVAYALSAFVVGRVDKPGLVHLPIVGDVFPWQLVFFYVGLPGLLVALLALTIREPRASGTRVLRDEVSARVPFADVWRYMRANARTIGALSFGFACSASVNYGVGAWLASFLIRTHEFTEVRAGLLIGVLTATLGPLGVVLGGRLTDALSKRGYIDAPLRVGMLGGLGMLIFAGLYPLVPSAIFAAALLVPVNIFAAMPWGAANAAIAEAMPPRMRGQGSAVYQLVVNLMAGVLGPTAVALLTDKVFRDPLALRYSLSLSAVVGMTLAIALLAWGRPAFRVTVQRLRDTGTDEADNAA
ncbi:MFS transporter [Gemmatimonas sp.]|uniref:spinster family MFS transporter n=1 Tax=Gemmatimonas sp. TaxID=1962908 RepID=UPI00286E67B8|nr:MFS transporter [Gemmatimonas sp.]